MNTLLKNMSRYIFKKKFSLLSLVVLIFLSIWIFFTCSFLSLNLKSSYDTLVEGGNLHNIVMSRNFKTKENKTNFYNELNIRRSQNISPTLESMQLSNVNVNSITDLNLVKIYNKLNNSNINLSNIQNIEKNPEIGLISFQLGLNQIVYSGFLKTSTTQLQDAPLPGKKGDLYDLNYRNFDSINISYSNREQNKDYKVIKYNDDYQIDKLMVSKGSELPSFINFKSIYDLSTEYLTYTGPITPEIQKSIDARINILYFMSLAKWSKPGLPFVQAYDLTKKILLTDKTFDPYNYTTYVGLTPEETKIFANCKTYLTLFLDKNGTNYLNPSIDKFKIAFYNMSDPLNMYSGYFSNFSSSVAVVSSKFLRDNNKKIFNLKDFENTTRPNGNFISENAFDSYMNSIPNEYKVYVDSVPFLIIGEGLSPDFMYPVIDFSNVIPDMKNQALIYLNDAGYSKVKSSFPSNTTEESLLIKYDGYLNEEQIVKKLNVLAHKYMSFPENVQIAYWFNDPNNKLSPSSLRVDFVTKLIEIVTNVSFVISGFILGLTIFVILLFAKRFIVDNKNTLAILIANGVSKIQVLSSVTILGFVPAFIGGIIGYVAALYSQSFSINLFSNYWIASTPVTDFNFAIFVLAFIIPIIIFVLTTYAIGYWLLRSSAPKLLKEDNTFKVTWLLLITKKSIDWASTMVKFRFSLAFSAVSKIVILTFITTLISSVFLFISSSADAFQNVIRNELRTNKTSFEIELETPTIQGGQYYPVNFTKLGMSSPYAEPSLISKSPLYQKELASSKLFQQWSSLQWPSGSDVSSYLSNPFFLKNMTQMQIVLDNTFGGGATATNPWENANSIMPQNQINLAKNLNNEFLIDALKDETPITFVPMASDPLAVPDTPVIPTNWVIGNINTPDVNNQTLMASNNEGFINAQNILDFKNLTADQIYDLNSKKPLINIINNYYSTQLVDVPYPQGLFTEITNLVINRKNNTISFSIKPQTNVVKNLWTVRSFLINKLFKSSDKFVLGTNQVEDPLNKGVYYNFDIKKIASSLFGMALKYNLNFINFVTSLLNQNYYQNKLYKLSYNSVPFNSAEDEKFVYDEGHIIGESNSSIKITGIESNSRFIDLTNENNEPINSLLFEKQENGTYPLVINSFAAKTYNWKIGSTFDFEPTNTVERYNKAVAPKIYKFKVVGISNLSHNSEFFTSIDNARTIIGLDKPEFNTRYTGNSFNGIFTRNKKPYLLTNSIPLYSPSGLYPVGSYYENSGVIKNLITSILKNIGKKQKEYDAVWNGFFNENVTLNGVSTSKALFTNQVNALTVKDATTLDPFVRALINQLNDVYGNLIYVTLLKNPLSTLDSIKIFKELTTTFQTLEGLIAILVIVLGMLIMFLLLWMMMNDSVKMAALLKTLGFSDFKNAMNFFTLLIPIWAFTTVLTVPVALLILEMFRTFAFANINVYLLMPLNIWAFFLISFGFFMFFALILFISVKFFERLNAVEALKW